MNLFKNLLLAYQLENYSSIRFLRFSYTHPRFWILGSQRQVLDWTAKVKSIAGLTFLLIFFKCIGIFYFAQNNSIFYFFVPIIFFLLPCYYIIANLLLFPIDIFLKKRIIRKAQKKLGLFPGLKVIAITGSYGKTSMKEVLTHILSKKYNVLAPEGNKNTPLGISELILTKLDSTYEIFIVEMGAYKKGDIKELCDIVHPHISILTGITLQHLERFGSFENIIDTKFEIIDCLKKEDTVFINTKSEGVKLGLQKKTFQVQNKILIGETAISWKYKDQLQGISFEFNKEMYETKILAPYIIEILEIAIILGKNLGLSYRDLEEQIKSLPYVKHRMELLYNPQNNILIIDDSYNGNIEGVRAILYLMEHAPFTGRKILVAGGIVELGVKTEEVHANLAPQIAQMSDKVLLIEGPIGNILQNELIKSGYEKKDILMYKTALLLHNDLKNILVSGDMLIFQNDLPDTYL